MNRDSAECHRHLSRHQPKQPIALKERRALVKDSSLFRGSLLSQRLLQVTRVVAFAAYLPMRVANRAKLSQQVSHPGSMWLRLGRGPSVSQKNFRKSNSSGFRGNSSIAWHRNKSCQMRNPSTSRMRSAAAKISSSLSETGPADLCPLAHPFRSCPLSTSLSVPVSLRGILLFEKTHFKIK